MASKTNSSKPKREGKTGRRGGPRTRLDNKTLILMGKGTARSLEPIKCSAWSGASAVGVPFDAEQAEKNRIAGF